MEKNTFSCSNIFMHHVHSLLCFLEAAYPNPLTSAFISFPRALTFIVSTLSHRPIYNKEVYNEETLQFLHRRHLNTNETRASANSQQ
jgi:hypothetical protein